MNDRLSDERLLLCEDRVDIRKDELSIEAPCRITFTLKTSPSIWIEINIDPQMEVGAIASLKFRSSGAKFEGFLESKSYGEYVTARFVPVLSGPISVGLSKNLVRVEFFIINFQQFYRQSKTGPMYRSSVDLFGGGWQMCIRQLPGDPVNVELYRRVGAVGRGFTHSATLRREDGSEFSSDACTRVLAALHVLLSFANGQWVTFVLVRGHINNGDLAWQNNGDLAWQEWGNRWIEHLIQIHHVWFDPIHGEALARVFPGFFDAWNLNKFSEEAIHTAVYWYLRSNSLGAGADGGLLLSQAALESIAQHVLVEELKTLPKAKFRALKASDKIRCLLKELAIPVQIPLSLEQLSAVTHTWEDGAHAVTAIRNLVTHSYGSSDLPVFEAWQMAQWYLELVLLHLFAFDGSYSNRTKQGKYIGQVDPVPWTVLRMRR